MVCYYDKSPEEGEAKGKAEGRAEGIEEGKKASQIKIARNLKAKGIDIAIIVESTGLSEAEIKKL